MITPICYASKSKVKCSSVPFNPINSNTLSVVIILTLNFPYDKPYLQIGQDQTAPLMPTSYLSNGQFYLQTLTNWNASYSNLLNLVNEISSRVQMQPPFQNDIMQQLSASCTSNTMQIQMGPYGSMMNSMPYTPPVDEKVQFINIINGKKDSTSFEVFEKFNLALNTLTSIENQINSNSTELKQSITALEKAIETGKSHNENLGKSLTESQSKALSPPTNSNDVLANVISSPNIQAQLLLKHESKRQAIEESVTELKLMASKRSISIEEYLEAVRLLSMKEMRAKYIIKKIVTVE